MKNYLYDALETYFKIKEQNKKLEDLNEDEIKSYTIITRDDKMMSVLNSFEPGIKPSLVDIVPRYNALLDEENEKAKTVTMDDSEIPNPSQKIEDSNKNVKSPNLMKKKTLTQSKLNQVGYANIVLMSIIVIIIVAIICVFIFVN